MIHRVLFLLFFAALLAGCSPVQGTTTATETPAGPAASGLDYAGLLAALQAEGAMATPGERSPFTSLSVNPVLITVNGEDVWVYEYADSAAAVQDAAYISPDGGQITVPDPDDPSIVTVSIIEWMAIPHFYRSGRIIVQYVGEDPSLISLLESLLGPQFAGGVPENRPPLSVGVIEPMEGAPMNFEEAVAQAPIVILAEVTDVVQGPDYVGNIEIPLCNPSQLVTLTVLEVYKGPLAADQMYTLYQAAGLTDTETGCLDDPAAELLVWQIMEHDPLYDIGQRYLLALAPLSGSLDPDPAIQAANQDLASLIADLDPGQVLFNGRLLVEQGPERLLEQGQVFEPAYDDWGRAIPGLPTGRSLADFEATLLLDLAGTSSP